MEPWGDDPGFPCDGCEHVERCARGGLACIAFRMWVSDPPGNWTPDDREPNAHDWFAVFTEWNSNHD